METLLVLLAVSTLAGSARSLNRNNSGGRRLGDGRHRALRDGERQIHNESIAQEPAITKENVTRVVRQLPIRPGLSAHRLAIRGVIKKADDFAKTIVIEAGPLARAKAQ